MKIDIYNEWDHVSKATADGGEQAVLAWDGEYRKGDIIEFSGLCPEHFYVIKVDAQIEASLVFVKTDTVKYTVPFYEKKSSYNPLSFFGNRHYLTIRYAREHEINAYRNLALNPFDQHDTDGVYPHASANVETRGEAVFAARNAIDGVIATNSHGEWPYASWGINRQDDAAFTLDIGYPADVDRIELYTRADFPHDNWWTSGRISFSDGSSMTISMDQHAGEPHVFDGLNKKGITWIRLDQLIKSDDPSPFPALTQIEVYGKISRK